MSEPIKMIVQLFDIKTRRDGGGRIQLEFGADSMMQVAELMKLNALGDTNLAIALVPVGAQTEQPHAYQNEDVDPETGEIIF